MKNLVNRALNELINDSKLNKNSLVKMLTESINKSLASNENIDSIYNQFKSGLVGINEHLKDKKIKNMIAQFDKSEKTVDSDLHKIGTIANLEARLQAIKESNAYTNPIIKDKVDDAFRSLKAGNPEFMMYPIFIREFGQHLHESAVKEQVDIISKVVNENASDLEVLYTINTLTRMNSKVYENMITDLKTMLSEKAYSADIIKLKLGQSGLPIVENLVNALKVIESRNSDNFTLGNGNGDTKISNVIVPAVRSKDGSLLMYEDNKFMRISKSKKKIKAESVHIEGGNFRISTVDPTYVAENYPSLYKLSESFANLGFNKSVDGNGVETSTIRNFKVGLRLDESKNLDVYLNDSKVEDLSKVNLTSALVMETSQIREKVEHVFSHLKDIFNFEFIKNISNDRTLHEATVFNLGKSYFICEKLNAAERNWMKVDEHEMYEYFMKNYQYDISPIFQTEINEAVKTKKQIETRKNEILENIKKLEGSVDKINESLQLPTLKKKDAVRLEKIKESIETSISSLKENYINVDLVKKAVNEQENPEAAEGGEEGESTDQKKNKVTISDDQSKALYSKFNREYANKKGYTVIVGKGKTPKEAEKDCKKKASEAVKKVSASSKFKALRTHFTEKDGEIICHKFIKFDPSEIKTTVKIDPDREASKKGIDKPKPKEVQTKFNLEGNAEKKANEYREKYF